MRDSEIVLSVYKHLIKMIVPEVGIPVKLKPKNTIGTVQDDPFDCWVGEQLKLILKNNFQVFHSGTLTSPDIVLRDLKNGQCVGLEIKKLIQQKNGSDSRGLTIDYNSSLPCGQTFIKVGDDTVQIPCFYLFALLDNTSSYIRTLIIMDGDFLNYDVDLHKAAKVANYTEYKHGPYEEGSVRHRAMYTYPNPLNSKIDLFFQRYLLVCKKARLIGIDEIKDKYDVVIRTDKYNNQFTYFAIDLISGRKLQNGTEISDIFIDCKKRTPKPRTAVMPTLPPL